VLPVGTVPVQVTVVVFRSVVIALLDRLTVIPGAGTLLEMLVGRNAEMFNVTPVGIPLNVNLTPASFAIVAPANWVASNHAVR
jgi:hypothetical protein